MADARALSRLLFEESDPVRALHLALEFYARSTTSRGRAKVLQRADDRAAVRLPRATAAPHCVVTLAFLRDAVHMATGARVEAIEERCVRRGDAQCVHQIRWDEPAA